MKVFRGIAVGLLIEMLVLVLVLAGVRIVKHGWGHDQRHAVADRR